MFFATVPKDQEEAFVSCIDAMMEKAIEKGKERLKKAMLDACDDLTGYVTLWEEACKENATAFDFMRTAQEEVFGHMLSSNPENWSKYQIDKLLKAWRERHPEELKASIDSIMAEKLAECEMKLAFQRRMNR